MILHIKNMVCNRCITAVENVFAELGFRDFKVIMGLIELNKKQISNDTKEQLKSKLIDLGFELIDDRTSKMIESIKNLIRNKIHNGDLSEPTVSWSKLIIGSIPYDYKYISRIFSSVEGITIEHFIIHQKIEKVKELIVYDELSLSEIAWKLGYSSVAHVSSQFKKITGMSPRDFKEIGSLGRKALDKV